MLGRPNGSIIGATQEPTPTSAGGIWTLPAQLELQKQGKWIAPGYNISRSLRFNLPDSAGLYKTYSSAGNRKTWTWSGWLKRSKLVAGGLPQQIFGARNNNTSPYTLTNFQGSGDFIRIEEDSGTSLITSASYRDLSSWYHIVIAFDTTQATAANRVKLYVNGDQVTAFSSETYPAQNADTTVNSTFQHVIGAQPAYGNHFDGYMAEIHFIDGQALDPSYFGVVDTLTGVWRPKQVENMTYGTNGFYLPFSDNTSTTTLGYDQSGNANNWTPNNFSVAAGAGNDSLVDTPTQYGTDTGAGGEVRGNYATLNPLAIDTANRTYSNGNLNVAIGATNLNVFGSIQIPTSGKWYWEFQITTIDQNPGGGIATGFISNLATGLTYRRLGDKVEDGNAVAYGATYTTTDIIGVAVDVDGGTVTFYKNGVSQGAITYNASGMFPVLRSQGVETFVINFGQRPFAYTAPSGFKALCTTNLPDPTVVQGDDYFNTVLYTGNNGTQSITGVGFQPDWVWIKVRNEVNSHYLFDQIRGADQALFTDSTSAEVDYSATGRMTSFDSDGFTVEYSSSTGTNASGDNYVAWNWKANGAGSLNEVGSIPSTVSANTTAGISIVTYTGNGTVGATVGHGLGAVPRMIIVKCRNAATSWRVYHTSIGNTGAVYLNTTVFTETNSVFWNNTSPTSSVFTLGNDGGVNASSNTFVAYCFAEVEGFSKFGIYTGNGSTDGPFVYTGFRPAWILVKRTDDVGSWGIFDSTRNTYNSAGRILYPDLSNAEVDSPPRIDFVSNGFKLRTDGYPNNAATTWIYAAFAENPFKYSLGR